ncbi:hypothetical protein ABEV55_14770 [Aneurinibacillus thermoaerophilus]|uniref:hypothetical protein n=1 Tax=Aneurinibacillus thermoaerophilus TaxID=143495 RepID=UPI002E235BDE|nr:hypothetical protein [Aneurinibacillus thermoaerophilus]
MIIIGESPKLLLYFSIFFVFFFFIVDVLDMGSNGFISRKAAKWSDQAAMQKSVEEGAFL